MLSAKELQDGLAGFYGTENYYRYMGNLLLTDGVKYLADNAGSYWILDIIWSYQKKCMKDNMLRDMQFWKLTVNLEKKTATVICERDTGDVAIKQEIEHTDFPLSEIKIWVAPSGNGRYVMLLPSEN